MDSRLEDKDQYTIGVISDTHGVVRPAVERAFRGVDMIIHAGDVGKASVISQLEKIAPVVAVRGNMDSRTRTALLPETETVRLGGVCILVIHQRYSLEDGWREQGYNCVIFGHEHEPILKEKDNVMFLNPGCAGEMTSTPHAALLHVRGSAMQVKFIGLD
jgi:putative phosphoesterase